MTVDAEPFAVDDQPTLSEALGCLDCDLIFRRGATCPGCGSPALLNVADCIGEKRVVERLDNARRGHNGGVK